MKDKRYTEKFSKLYEEIRMKLRHIGFNVYSEQRFRINGRVYCLDLAIMKGDLFIVF